MVWLLALPSELAQRLSQEAQLRAQQRELRIATVPRNSKTTQQEPRPYWPKRGLRQNQLRDPAQAGLAHSLSTEEFDHRREAREYVQGLLERTQWLVKLLPLLRAMNLAKKAPLLLKATQQLVMLRQL